MPPVNAENDLKRRARRRLIGAVALALAAVILVPLLLEDEPPPAGHLQVRMKSQPGADSDAPDQPIVAVVPSVPVGQPLAAPEADPPAADEPSTPPVVQAPPPAPKPAPPKPAAQLAPPKPAPPKPAPSKPAPTKPAPVAPEVTRAAPAKPAPTPSGQPLAGAFVVQLAALKDASRAADLRQRAAHSGLPVYTDRAGEFTRVRVGPFASREEAVAAAVRLGEIGLAGQIVSR